MNQRIINFIAIAFVAVVAAGVGGAMVWKILHPPAAVSAPIGNEIRFGPPPEAPPGVKVPRQLSASPGPGDSPPAGNKGNSNPKEDE